MKILLIMKNAVLSFFIFSMVFFQLNCLRPKKSAFDTSSSSGLFFAGILFSTTGVTVGGSISGHSSGTLILKNGNDEKKIEPNTANYSFSVSRNSTYSISVVTYPEGLSCAVENATGTASGTVTNANVKCSALVFQTLFANNGKNWNDYIQRDYSKSLLSQADTACNPTSGSNENYFSCIHAAEIRSLELPAGVTCEGITASDDANSTGGAFNWICTPQSQTKFIVHSTGFRNGDLGDLKNDPPPGLSDLIDWTLAAPAFKKLKLTVKKNDITLVETTPSVWWGNSFRNNAACPLVITGGETNTIFTFTSGTGSYNINSTCFLNSPKLSFVVDPKIQITQNSGGYILVSNNSNHFTLLEGRINGAGGLGLAIDTTGGPNFIVGRNLRVYNTSVSLFNFRTTSIFSYFKNLIVANNSAAMGKGLVVANFASRNIFDGVSSFNNNDEGVSLEGGNSNIFLNTISSSNNINGIRFSSASSSNNKFLSLTSSLNSLTGITFSAGATQNYFMNSLVTNNNSGSNTGLSMTIGGIDTTLLNLSSNNNNTGSDSQIASSGTAGGNRRFMGTLRVSLNNCIGSGFNEDGINNSCIATGLSDFVSPGIINFQSGNNPFISGTPKSNSDSVNPSFSSSGIATIGSIGSNWTNFQNFYRTIALSMGNAFPHPSLVGRCTTNCQLYDWSFSKSDASGLRNILRCPLNLARPTLDLYGPVILRNAVEILGDWKGNDDGLCNSNEECIYTPNIGAYQGHGKLVPASTANDSYPNATNQCADITTASGSDGTVNNIKLFKYEKNGY